MDYDSFKVLVKRMREAQKEYFRTRSKYALRTSKDLERQVDLALQEDQEPKLFA